MAAITRREYKGAAAATTLSSDITDSSTSITVDNATNWPTGANPFFIVIDEGSASEEKILCSGRSSNTLSVSSRGADGTSASSHDAGATVKHVWTAQDADDVNKVAAALTTKGDLLGFTTEPARIAVGSDGEFLKADSSAAGGVSWSGASSVFVGAGHLEPQAGSPAIGSAFGWVYWLLDSAASELVGTSVVLPSGWATYSVTAVWINAGAGSGDVVLRVQHANLDAGDSLTRTLADTTHTAAGQNVISESSLASGLAATAGNYTEVNVGRIGGDGSDTLGNDIGLLGVLLTKDS